MSTDGNCSTDDSEESPEINLSRYTQQYTQTQLQPQALFQGRFSDSSACINQQQSASQHYDGLSFSLNQPANCHISSSALFNRRKFVTDIVENKTGGRLLCAVVSTYGLDEVNFLKEIPSLMGPGANIPTLILFGKKVRTDSSDGVCEEQEQEWLGDKRNVSPSLCLVRVTPRHRRASYMGYTDKGKGILGVHHPKYMLLFTTKGLHVMISTANMTPQVHAAEGTFTQFFPVQATHSTATTAANNDFGEILDDFLNKVPATSCSVCRTTTLLS